VTLSRVTAGRWFNPTPGTNEINELRKATICVSDDHGQGGEECGKRQRNKSELGMDDRMWDCRLLRLVCRPLEAAAQAGGPTQP
jgi:hypothetical protein